MRHLENMIFEQHSLIIAFDRDPMRVQPFEKITLSSFDLTLVASSISVPLPDLASSHHAIVNVHEIEAFYGRPQRNAEDEDDGGSDKDGSEESDDFEDDDGGKSKSKLPLATSKLDAKSLRRFVLNTTPVNGRRSCAYGTTCHYPPKKGFPYCLNCHRIVSFTSSRYQKALNT